VIEYTDKVVIVTGGTKGIGRATVEVFAAAGARVVFCSHEDEGGQPLAESATAKGPGRASFERCDVSQADAFEQFVQSVGEREQRIDCLVNNAGWHPPHKAIDDFTVDEFRSLLELNVVSVFVGCRAALPWLRQSRGAIVNIASLVATIGQHHATTYVATKGAVLALTKALAVDEAHYGVRVNAISPGNIYTPLWQQAIDQSSDPGRTRADGEAAQPLGRMGTPHEVGRLCLYLAAEATFTTGADHFVTGAAELDYGRKVRP
jgi:NAD(P)-dependent dehydrogenase (short-subunit alcohol dehydrogenase family)